MTQGARQDPPASRQAIALDERGSILKAKNVLTELLQRKEREILDDWMREQAAALTLRPDLISKEQLRGQSESLLRALRTGIETGLTNDIDLDGWADMRGLLLDVSRDRAQRGFSASETATFVFSLKQPLFAHLRQMGEGRDLLESVWNISSLLDAFGLYTAEVYVRTREDIIKRQQAELLELSTPVVQLWDGILALPMIGTLDSARTQVVMEALLQRIVDTGSQIAILDITGVPTVDTLVAQHLIKTVAAARLMGADCIISGIRPQIAQTMVHLAIDLSNIATKASLADAFVLALTRIGADPHRMIANQGAAR